MASEITTTALIDEALKVIFAKSLHDDIVVDHELMDIFKAEMNVKSDETTGGRWVEQGHFWQYPAGFGWRQDNEYIPEAVSAKFKNSRLYLRKGQGVLEMSGDTMRRVKTDEGAFLDYMEKAKPALIEGVNNDLDLAYLGTGSGIKAEVASKDGAGTAAGTYKLGVKHHSGIPGYTEAWLAFLEGQNIIFATNATFTTIRAGSSARYATVVGIVEDRNQIVVKCDATLYSNIQANDCIAEGDGAGYSAMDTDGNPRVMAGLLAGDDNGDIVEVYNNIDRTADDARLWRSHVIDAQAESGGALTEDLLDLAFRRAVVRGNAKITHIIMSHSASTMYWRGLRDGTNAQGQQRFVNVEGNFTSGKGKLGIRVGDTVYPVRVCRKLPPEVVFGLQADRWARLTLGALTWEDETGSMWNRVVDSTGRKDAYYSTFHLYEQLYCIAPQKQFRIDGLNPAEHPAHAS